MIWVNGVASDCLPVTDRGLLYGDGVWETLAVTQGQPQLLEWHLERLQQGLHALAIDQPDWAMLRTEIDHACHVQVSGVLKLMMTRGSGSRGYNPNPVRGNTRILQTSDYMAAPAGYTENGIRLFLCATRLAQQPRLAGFKHLNRLEQVLARAEFGNDYQEGLVCDYQGHVIEGTMSNLFIVHKDGSVCTPDLHLCGIAGIMRRFIIQTLADFGLRCDIRAVALTELAQAQALFMTNSLIGLWPVREFSNQTYPVPPLLRDLQAAIQTLQ